MKHRLGLVSSFGGLELPEEEQGLGAESAADLSEAEMNEIMEEFWRVGGARFLAAFGDTIISERTNHIVAEFVRNKIRQIVHDPEVAETLCPRNHPIGTKRICVDTNYYATFNRDNVTLVDISGDPIEEITPGGVRVAERVYEVDAVVSATGFDAMTGSLDRIDIRGAGGKTLREKWAAGPRTFLGLTTAGFPNFFIISGPGSPSVLTNMINSIEQHVEFVADSIGFLRRSDLHRIEATLEAEDDWVDHVNEVAGETLLLGCNSWYLGANIPGKPRVFMPYLGFPAYVEKCESVVENGYEGFHLS